MQKNYMPDDNNIAATILSNIGDGVISTDLFGHITYMNRMAEEILNCKAESSIGKLFDEVFTIYDDVTKTKQNNPVAYVIDNAAQTGLQNNTVLILDNQIEKYVSATCTPVKSDNKDIIGVAVVFRDISRFKKLELLHINESNNLKSIFDHTPAGMLIVDENIIILDVNVTIIQYINKNREDIIGKRFGESIDCFSNTTSEGGCGTGDNCKNCEIRKSVLQVYSSGQTANHIEIKLHIYKDDKEHDAWFRISFNPVIMNGKKLVAITMVDISISKQQEISATEIKEAAELANNAKSEFLANMSHEIRTPINGIVGMIDLTLLTGLNDDQRDNLLTAKACASSLLSIVNDVLDFSKMEAGKMTLENVNFDLKDLIEEIVRTHSPRVFDKGLDLNYLFSSSIPRYLIGDPNRLRQILNNLLSNAIKFTEHGEVTIMIKSTSMTKDEVELKFSVSDTGIGIAKEDLSKLFHSFSQIENTYTKKYSGTGLGLVISKQIVETMGGGIEIESEPGKGSNFTFYIKFKIGNPIADRVQALPWVQKTTKPLHILLVEDDRINQKVISKMLIEKGHVVMTADNGINALECYASDTFDAILMDIQMPKMNGIDAAQKIKMLERDVKHTPIIAMTAYALPGDRERFLNLGMDAYVAKPLQMEELFFVLDQLTTFPNQGTPHNVSLSETGEVIFNFDKPKRLSEHNKEVLNDIAQKIRLLKEERVWSDFTRVEKIANDIKRISNNYDITDIKDTAFKIELAARRSKEDEINKYIDQITEEFLIYKNTNE